jgi:hypothetical protein
LRFPRKYGVLANELEKALINFHYLENIELSPRRLAGTRETGAMLTGIHTGNFANMARFTDLNGKLTANSSEIT